MNYAKATKEYIDSHPDVRSCIKKGLVNYSGLARNIAEQLGTEKESGFDAIMIACRRYAEKGKFSEGFEKQVMKLVKEGKFELSNKISTFIISAEMKPGNIMEFAAEATEKTDHFHLIQGTKSFTLITDDALSKEIEQQFAGHIIKTMKGLVQVTHKTSDKVEVTPGFLAYMASIFSDNGVNIYESLSSWTDTIFIISEKDASKIFSMLNTKQ